MQSAMYPLLFHMRAPHFKQNVLITRKSNQTPSFPPIHFAFEHFLIIIYAQRYWMGIATIISYVLPKNASAVFESVDG